MVTEHDKQKWINAAVEAGGPRMHRIVTLLLERKLREWDENDKITIPVRWEDAYRQPGVGPSAMRILDKIGFMEKQEVINSGLSTRASNILNNNNIKSKEEAAAAIAARILTPWKIRNYGWMTHKEVCEWAGCPERYKPTTTIVCPHCGKDTGIEQAEADDFID